MHRLMRKSIGSGLRTLERVFAPVDAAAPRAYHAGAI